MNDSVKLFVVFMVFWAMIVVIFNLLGQAMAMPGDSDSPIDSSMAAGSAFQVSDSNAPTPEEAFGHGEQDHSLDKNRSDPNKPLVDLIFMGQGFALRGDESHVLFVSIQKIRDIDPKKVRSLLNANKSLEEMRGAINEQNAEIIYGGDIKLSEKSYRLANVNITKLQTGQGIEADLMGSQEEKYNGALNAVKGHITLIVPDSKISETCRGELAINADGFFGTYQVFLSILPL